MTIAETYRAEWKHLKRSMAAVAVISVLANLCMLATPLFLYQVYDHVIFSRNIDTLFAVALIAGAVLITFGLLDAIRGRLLSKIGATFEARLAGLLLGAELASSQRAQRQTLTHLAAIRQALTSNVFPALFDLPTMAVFLTLGLLRARLAGRRRVLAASSYWSSRRSLAR